MTFPDYEICSSSCKAIIISRLDSFLLHMPLLPFKAVGTLQQAWFITCKSCLMCLTEITPLLFSSSTFILIFHIFFFHILLVFPFMPAQVFKFTMPGEVGVFSKASLCCKISLRLCHHCLVVK